MAVFHHGRFERTERPTVVRVVVRSHLPSPSKGLIDCARARLVAKKSGRLTEIADEDKGPRSFEDFLEAPRELEQEARSLAHGVADIAEDDELRRLPAPLPSDKLEGDAARAQARSPRAMRVDGAHFSAPATNSERAAEPLAEGADRPMQPRRVGLAQRCERNVRDRMLASRGIELADPPFVQSVDVRLGLFLEAIELGRHGVGELGSASAERLHEHSSQPRKGPPGVVDAKASQQAMGVPAESQLAARIHFPAHGGGGERPIEFGCATECDAQGSGRRLIMADDLFDGGPERRNLGRVEAERSETLPEALRTLTFVLREKGDEFGVVAGAVTRMVNHDAGNRLTNGPGVVESHGVDGANRVDGLLRLDDEAFAAQNPEEVVDDLHHGRVVAHDEDRGR